jgi:hypothetical protein
MPVWLIRDNTGTEFLVMAPTINRAYTLGRRIVSRLGPDRVVVDVERWP